MLNLQTSEKEEENDKKDNNDKGKNKIIKDSKNEEKSYSIPEHSNKNTEKSKKLNSSKNHHKISNKSKYNNKLLINSKQSDIFSHSSKSKNDEIDIEELKKRIKILEEKASNLEKKNIYYYNILKRNLDWNYEKEYKDPIEEYIDMKRKNNLNGYNQLIIDINDKINDFIEDEKIRDKEKLEYYKSINELNDDIIYRIHALKLLQEKEREKDIERKDINKNYFVINYNKKSGEVNYDSNNYINERYGNPFNKKTFYNDRTMMPAKYSKNGIAVNNQYISIDNPGEYFKYQIYHRYNNDYKKYSNDILKRNGSKSINSNENYLDYKNHNGKKIRVSASSDNIS